MAFLADGRGFKILGVALIMGRGFPPMSVASHWWVWLPEGAWLQHGHCLPLGGRGFIRGRGFSLGGVASLRRGLFYVSTAFRLRPYLSLSGRGFLEGRGFPFGGHGFCVVGVAFHKGA